MALSLKKILHIYWYFFDFFDSFSHILLQPLPESLENTIYVFLLLAKDHFNTTNETCHIMFSPFIVNGDGVMIYSNKTSYIPRVVTCEKDAFDQTLSDLIVHQQNLMNSLYDDQAIAAVPDLIYLDILRYNDSWSACERQMNQYFDVLLNDTLIEVTVDDYCLSLKEKWVGDSCCNGSQCCPSKTYVAVVPQYVKFTSEVIFLHITLKFGFEKCFLVCMFSLFFSQILYISLFFQNIVFSLIFQFLD